MIDQTNEIIILLLLWNLIMTIKIWTLDNRIKPKQR